MIFSKRCSIIFIGKEKIRWTEGRVPSGRILDEVKEMAGSEENLRTAIRDIADHFSKRVRVVVGEEFAYAAYLKKAEHGADIRIEAGERIPEKIENAWDTQEKGDDAVQVMVIQEGLFAILQNFFLEMKLTAEAIEAESVSLSRIIPAKKGDTVIFARQDGKLLLGAVRDSAVLATEVFSSPPGQEDIRKFISYVSGRYGVTIRQVFIADNDDGIREMFQNLGLFISEAPLDPLVGICKKRDIRGRDADILNITLAD